MDNFYILQFFLLAYILSRRFFFEYTKEDLEEDKEDVQDIIAICSFYFLFSVIWFNYMNNLDIYYEICSIFPIGNYIYNSCLKDRLSQFISNIILNSKEEIIICNNIFVTCKIIIKNYLCQADIDSDSLHNVLNNCDKSVGVFPNDKNITKITIKINNDCTESLDLYILFDIIKEEINNKLEEYKAKKNNIFFNTSSFEIEYEFHLDGSFENYHMLNECYFKSTSSLFLINSNITNDLFKEIIYGKFFRKIEIKNPKNISLDLITNNKYILQNTNYVNIINCQSRNLSFQNIKKYTVKEINPIKDNFPSNDLKSITI